MNSCRIFPSSVQSWKPLLQKIVLDSTDGAKSSEPIVAPPHFQAYCVSPTTNKVMDGFDYSSMLSASNMPSPKRRSGVLVLLEPVQYVAKNNKGSQSSSSSSASGGPILSNELRTIITQRTSHLRNHRGEISFPGGKCDDNETPIDAAIREGIEEIGAEPGKYEVLGQLSQVYSFPSRSMVTPTVAISKGTTTIEVDEDQEKARAEKFLDKVKAEEGIVKAWNADPANKEKVSPIAYTGAGAETSNPNREEDEANKKAMVFDSSLGLKITSACEVDRIQSMNLCELLLSTEKHQFLERQWKAPGKEKAPPMKWILPAFYTHEDQALLWGLTGFIFCELLCKLALVLQQENMKSNNNNNFLDDASLTPFEREARKNLLSFYERSSQHYLEQSTSGKVIGLPPHNHSVKFLNPYDRITSKMGAEK